MFNLLNRKKTLIEISPSIVVFTTSLLLFLTFLFHIREIIVILFMGFIVMVALNPGVNKLEKKLKSRPLSILLVYLLLLSFLSAVFALLVPPLAVQLNQLLKMVELPYLQEEITTLRFTALELNQLVADYGGSITALLSAISSTFKSLFTFLTLLVISFYLIIDEPKLHKKLGWFTKNEKHFDIARMYLDDLQKQLGGWIRGQVIIMLLIGLATYLGLEIIGIPFALPLGLLALFLEILPNIGPTLAAIPSIVIALFHGGLVSAGVVLLFYLVLQQVESNLITPRIMKSSADVNPLVSITSILAGFKLGGVIGGLLAVPFYIVLRITYRYYLKYQNKLKPDW